MAAQTVHHDPPTSNPDPAELADKIRLAAPHLAALLAIFAPANSNPSPDEHLTIPECVRVSKRSRRMISEAIRAGNLPAAGRQKDRTVRRADLEAWIASRNVVHASIDDADVERRIARLARTKKGGQ